MADRASDVPASVRRTQQRGRELGLEPTGNFEQRTDAAADYLCFAARPLELPEDYRGLRFRRTPDGNCRFDPERWDVLRYQPEAVASERAGVTPQLAAAPEARADFVVAHEEFHDQPEIRQLPPGIHEPAATLAGFLIRPGPDDDAIRPATLYLRKARLTNLYRWRAARLYERYRRGELARSDALQQKEALFASLRAECSQLAADPAFNPCPAALNNAGLAFDVTYTRLYPLIYELLPAAGWDREKALRALRVDLPEAEGLRRSPRKALRELSARISSGGR